MNTIRRIRERLGLTQTSLAESLGVTQGNVAHYEKGQTMPPDVARRLICRAKELGHEITFDDVYKAEVDESSPNGGSTKNRIKLSKETTQA